MPLLSIEVLPQHLREFLSAYQTISDRLPKGALSVMVPHINGSQYQSVMDACVPLMEHPISVVPHLAARNLTASDDIASMSRFFEDNRLSALLLGGDNASPHRFDSVGDLINQHWTDSPPFQSVYFASFPEGHPHVSQEDSDKALVDKCAWAEQNQLSHAVINQICFDAAPIMSHHERLGTLIPSARRIGSCVAPCQITKLIKIAAISGIQNTASFLKKHNVFKMLKQYNSDELMRELSHQQVIFSGLHVYPFGNYSGAFDLLLSYLDSRDCHDANSI